MYWRRRRSVVPDVSRRKVISLLTRRQFHRGFERSREGPCFCGACLADRCSARLVGPMGIGADDLWHDIRVTAYLAGFPPTGQNRPAWII